MLKTWRRLPTEDELRRVLADQSTASAVLFITPEVEASPIIRNVEVVADHPPRRSRRWILCGSACRRRSRLSQGGRSDEQPFVRPKDFPTGTCRRFRAIDDFVRHAAEIAHRVLVQRLRAIHRQSARKASACDSVSLCASRRHSSRASALRSIGRPHFADKEATADIGATPCFPR